MPETAPTGNPVFDYRAGFRAAAAALQRWLVRLGLFAAILSCVALVVGRAGTLTRETAAWGLLAGLAIAMAGILWGFLWRRKLRQDFQREFGPKN